MSKDTKYIIGAIVIVFLLLTFSQPSVNPVLKGIEKTLTAYSGASTYSTVSVTGVAVEILPKATSSRSYAEICNLGAGRVWIFKQATSTGVAVNTGKALYSTSTTNGVNCVFYGVDDPYTGAVWGVSSEATSTVDVEFNQK